MAELKSLFSSGIPQASSLDCGSNPTGFVNEAKGVIQNYSTLPNRTSPEKVISVAKRAGELEAQALLRAKLSKNQIAAANSAMAMLRTDLNHAKAAMNLKNQYAQEMGRFGKETMKQSLNFSETNANYQSYQAEMNNAAGMIRF